MRKRRTLAKIRVACRDFLEGKSDALEAAWALNDLLPYDWPKYVLLSEQDLGFINRICNSSESRSMLVSKWHPNMLPEKLKLYEQVEAAARQELTMVCNRILDANPRLTVTSEVLS